MIYGAPTVDLGTFAGVGGIARAYLNHRHEAMFGTDLPGVPLFVHEADGAAVPARAAVRGTFSRRHALDHDLEVIPTPGHTPGATAYLWDSGEHRLLFTGDTIYLRDGEWVAAVLDSSDRPAYLDSLAADPRARLRRARPVGRDRRPAVSRRDEHRDARRRIDAIIDRVRRGEDR